MMDSQAAEFPVDEPKQVIQSFLIAVAPSLKQCGHILRRWHEAPSILL